MMGVCMDGVSGYRSPAWRARLATGQAEQQAIMDALAAGDRAALDASRCRHRSLNDALADLQVRNPSRPGQKGGP